MNTIWKTTLDGVEYSGIYNRWGVVRLLPGKVPADGYGTERGMVMRYPYYRLGYFINSMRAAGQPWEWCTDEEFFGQAPPAGQGDAERIAELELQIGRMRDRALAAYRIIGSVAGVTK